MFLPISISKLMPGAALLAVFCGGLILGSQCTAARYESKLASLQRQAAEQQAEALNKVLSRERRIQANFAEAERQAAVERDSLDARYHSALAELERLRNGAGDDAVQVPADSTASAPCGVADTRDDRRNRAGLANLQKRILDLGKERDRCAIRYNQLLQLYQSAQQHINEGQN